MLCRISQNVHAEYGISYCTHLSLCVSIMHNVNRLAVTVESVSTYLVCHLYSYEEIVALFPGLQAIKDWRWQKIGNEARQMGLKVSHNYY